MSDPLLTASAAAFVVSACTAPFVGPALSRLSIVDAASERSSHFGAIPRGAGISVVASVVVGVSAALFSGSEFSFPWSPLFVTAAAGVVGFVDDVRGLAASLRLGLVALSSLLVIIEVDPALSSTSTLGYATAVGVCLAMVNSFNFMDGINGITAMTSAVVGASLAIAGLRWVGPSGAVLPACISAACVGFAPVNFPRARVFLGDVGSYGIGAALGSSALLLYNGGVPLLAVSSPFFIYFADVSFTLLRRAIRRSNLLEAHREHVYQRLANEHWGHTITTTYVAALTAICCVLGFAGSGASSAAKYAAAAACLVGAYLLTPELIAYSKASDRVKRSGHGPRHA